MVRSKIKIERTDTTKFLLPVYKIGLKRLTELGFINCFLKDEERETVNETDLHLYLLFKTDEEQQKELQKIIGLLEKKEGEVILLEDYDYSENYMVLVFKFPEKFRNDYQLFIEGKYSHLSDAIQATYPEKTVADFYPFTPLEGKSLQWMVCHKDPALKRFLEQKHDLDLSDAPEYYHLIDMDNETLTENTIKKYEDICLEK
jgi:hypothetical protein